MPAKSVRFKTMTFSTRGNTAGIEVPADKVEALGQGKRVPVVVSSNGFTHHNTFAVMGRKVVIGVNSDIRKSTGLKVDDKVDVILTLDEKPREVKIPDALQKILDNSKASKEFFESLYYSNKLRFALQIDTAKTPEILKKRIDLVTKALKDKKENPIKSNYSHKHT